MKKVLHVVSHLNSQYNSRTLFSKVLKFFQLIKDNFNNIRSCEIFISKGSLSNKTPSKIF